MLSFVANVKMPDHLFIGGKWTKPHGTTSFDVLNSSTEELFGRFSLADEADIDNAVSAARKAFDTGPWPQSSHAERAKYLRKIATALSERQKDSASAWAAESGVLHAAAKRSQTALSGVYEYYAGLGTSFPFIEEHVPKAGGNVGLLVREPVGVVAAIIPWNAPAALIAYKCAPALLAGCTLVVKASPEAPTAAYILAEICEEIGIPPGVLNVLTADRDVSERLVRHADVDKVTFTGSTAVGRRIAAICGERIARCTLELGGKSAAVIFDDYDLNLAAQTLATRATYISGQVCSSLTRIIISQHRHDALVDALSAAFNKIKVGDAFDEASEMGPLATLKQRERVENYIAQGVAEGAVLAAGGARPAHLNRGFFVEPTVFGNVNNHALIAQEEIFGPVLSVIPAGNEVGAVELANESIYGLNASVFTNDVERAYAAARKLRSGTVGHNSFRTDFSIAFGGFKQSGIGREGGVEGLLPFLETKTVILDGKPSAL